MLKWLVLSCGLVLALLSGVSAQCNLSCGGSVQGAPDTDCIKCECKAGFSGDNCGTMNYYGLVTFESQMGMSPTEFALQFNNSFMQATSYTADEIGRIEPRAVQQGYYVLVTFNVALTQNYDDVTLVPSLYSKYTLWNGFRFRDKETSVFDANMSSAGANSAPDLHDPHCTHDTVPDRCSYNPSVLELPAPPGPREGKKEDPNRLYYLIGIIVVGVLLISMVAFFSYRCCCKKKKLVTRPAHADYGADYKFTTEL